jgi:hypothetical protein
MTIDEIYNEASEFQKQKKPSLWNRWNHNILFNVYTTSFFKAF